MSRKKIIFSGVQPSGQLSIGNYLGALKNFTALQNTHECHFCVVDLHAITVRQKAADLRENSYAVAAWYLAAGLDPQKCTLFIQSHVPEHTELAWVLSTFTQMGELERMTQFKDKAQRHKHNINAGLFTYPTLMAADILLYHTDLVPVGNDQKQHLELARDIAQRFNGEYGDIFTVPEPLIAKVAARVKDLQHPEKKMSKSEAGQGCVLMLDEPAAAAKKIRRAVTDNEALIRWDEASQPGVTNLLGIFAACNNLTPEQAVHHFEGKRYGDLKNETAQAVTDALEPMQEHYHALMNNRAELDDILHAGAQKARSRAKKVMATVREAVGFVV